MPAQIKPKSFESRQNSFLPWVDVPHIYMHAWALGCLGCFHSHISTQTFRRALTALVDSCMEIKSAPSVALLNLAEFGGRSWKVMLGVWVLGCRSPKKLQPIRTVDQNPVVQWQMTYHVWPGSSIHFNHNVFEFTLQTAQTHGTIFSNRVSPCVVYIIIIVYWLVACLGRCCCRKYTKRVFFAVAEILFVFNSLVTHLCLFVFNSLVTHLRLFVLISLVTHLHFFVLNYLVMHLCFFVFNSLFTHLRSSFSTP